MARNPTAKSRRASLSCSSVDRKNASERVPAEVRERYDKLQQKDLPGVMSTASSETDDEEDNDNNDEDADADADDDDGSDASGALMQQVFYQTFPRSYRTLNAAFI